MVRGNRWLLAQVARDLMMGDIILCSRFSGNVNVCARLLVSVDRMNLALVNVVCLTHE
jgi:hypothetical protein